MTEIRYTIRDVADDCGVPIQAIQYLRSQGHIEATKHHGRWTVSKETHSELVKWYQHGTSCYRCGDKAANWRWRHLGGYCADCGRVTQTALDRAREEMLSSSHCVAHGEALRLKASVMHHRTDIAILALLQAFAVAQFSEVPVICVEKLYRAARLVGLKITETELRERLVEADWIKVEMVNTPEPLDDEEVNRDGDS